MLAEDAFSDVVREAQEIVERALKGGRLARAFRKPCEAGATLAEEVRERWQPSRSR